MIVSKKKIFDLKNQEIHSITFKNDNNYQISFYTYGGYIHNIIIPYKNNPKLTEDVILGYRKIEDCIKAQSYFNSIIGRVSNRISNASFNLNNKKYNLFKNSGKNHLHGGKFGFNKKIWKIKKISKSRNEMSCELSFFSKDLEEGYPGNINCTTTYTLNNQNQFKIKFSGVSDKDTLLNITNHNYWNFHGHGKFYKNICDHNVTIFSKIFYENNKDNIPTGKLIKVRNTNFDFLEGKNITQEFLDYNKIDNNYEISNDYKLKKIAKVYSNLTRMGVTYFSDQPGVQFYTGNMMMNRYRGKNNKEYGPQYGLCIEPHYPPNAINMANFISPVLRMNKKYQSNILMKLSNNF